MGGLVARRVAETALILVLALTTVFFLLRLTGDPVLLMVPLEATTEQIEDMRRQFGYDQPLPVQYARYMLSALHGDFGESTRQHAPALEVVLNRFPATLELLAASMLLALLVAEPLGLWAAARPGSVVDQAAMVLAVVGQAIPGFWLGIMLVLAVSVNLGLLPTSGRGTLLHLILPAVTQASYIAPRLARVSRSSLLEVLGHDYIRTAQAKGLTRRSVLWRHALRNAAIPIVTMIGLQVAPLFGGAVVVEVVFAWPGLGQLLAQSLANRDFAVVQAAVFAIACSVTLTNLAVDIAYAAINPRIRLA